MDKDSFSHDRDLEEILRGLESKKEEYPTELLAARRKLFMDQVEKYAPPESANERVEIDQKLLELFLRLKAINPEYPLQLLARRRALYKERIVEANRASVLQVLRSLLASVFGGWGTSPHATFTKFVRVSALALGIAMFAVMASALYGTGIPSSNSLLPQKEIFTGVLATPTSTSQAVVICRDGYEPPLCLIREFDNSHDLSYAGNGKARPAVAKDTFAGTGKIHHAAHINDGLYGPGASWVSNSPHSWIKIDLGTTTNVNTIAFGRDRLGSLNDGDPGDFVIAVATSDDVYANGNSSNDEREYVKVYDSKQAGFDGKISGGETVVAFFEMKRTRYIKITFENARTAIDEVEAFVSDPAVIAIESTRATERDDASLDASTPFPVNTPLPSDTGTAVAIDTLPPTETVTPLPTDPVTPVETPTPIDTPVPTDPVEPTIPAPTDTPVPPPSYTPILLPTDEPTPSDEQNTPVPEDPIGPQ